MCCLIVAVVHQLQVITLHLLILDDDFIYILNVGVNEYRINVYQNGRSDCAAASAACASCPATVGSTVGCAGLFS